jgi:hypothetical protein
MCLLRGTNWVFISQKTAILTVTAVKPPDLTPIDCPDLRNVPFASCAAYRQHGATGDGDDLPSRQGELLGHRHHRPDGPHVADWSANPVTRPRRVPHSTRLKHHRGKGRGLQERPS